MRITPANYHRGTLHRVHFSEREAYLFAPDIKLTRGGRGGWVTFYQHELSPELEGEFHKFVARLRGGATKIWRSLNGLDSNQLRIVDICRSYFLQRLHPEQYAVEPLSKRRVNWRHLKPGAWENPLSTASTGRLPVNQQKHRLHVVSKRSNPLTRQEKIGLVSLAIGALGVGAAFYFGMRTAKAAETTWKRVQPDSTTNAWMLPTGTQFRVSATGFDAASLLTALTSPAATIGLVTTLPSDWPSDDPNKAPTDVHFQGSVVGPGYYISGPFAVWTKG